jgi:hypothetical protein
MDWKFKYSKLENHQGYLNQTILLILILKNRKFNFYIVMIFNLLLKMIIFKKLFVIMKDWEEMMK